MNRSLRPFEAYYEHMLKLVINLLGTIYTINFTHTVYFSQCYFFKFELIT